MAKTGIGGTLVCITGDHQLWWRPPVEVDTNWTPIGIGPGAETKALGSAGGMLYAVDTAGVLWRTPARRAAPAWAAMTFFAGDWTVNAMTGAEIPFSIVRLVKRSKPS